MCAIIKVSVSSERILIYNTMEQLQNNIDTQLPDNVSVFSFCADARTQKTTKYSMSISCVQTAVVETQCVAAIPDDILSMIDFFVGASDCDTQASNAGSKLLMNDVSTQNPQTRSEGVDLLRLTHSHNLISLRKRKINKMHNKMRKANVHAAHVAAPSITFSGAERALSRFGRANCAQWMHE